MQDITNRPDTISCLIPDPGESITSLRPYGCMESVSFFEYEIRPILTDRQQDQANPVL